jgi:cytochrome c oxidase subunit 2
MVYLEKNITKKLARKKIIPLARYGMIHTIMTTLLQPELHLVVNKPVHLIIGSKDVIHDVGLTAFRMKMDAVPGTPTTMWFTPKFTTRQMIEKSGDPDFVYELSCDQMCGKGHYTMRGVVIVETQEEYDRWIISQKSQYSVAHPQPSAPKPPPADTTKGVAINLKK